MPSKVKMEGYLPIGDLVVMASADSVYFLKHAKALVNSCRKYNNQVHIHIVNPTATCHKLAESLDISYSWNTPGMVNKTYYACSRFLVAPVLMREVSGLIITDIDAYLRKHIPKPDSKIEIGLFFRSPLSKHEWTNRGTKVAAGLVYLTPRAQPYISSVNKRLHALGMSRWYVDQVALYEAYLEFYVPGDSRVLKFDERYLDWEFKPDSYIWTGKGSRKNNNKRYLNGKRELENM